MRQRVRTYGPIVTTCAGREVGHQIVVSPGILKQSEMFVENHSPAVCMTCAKYVIVTWA